MIMIGRYLVFIICLVDLTLSVNEIFNDESNFLNYIFELHNEARFNHGVQPLRRDVNTDLVAKNILNNISLGIYRYPEWYEVNRLERIYNNSTRLDAAEAEAVFSEWYDKEENDNELDELSNNDAAEFTRIVSENANEFGIAMKREEGYYRVVALYYPPGNVHGQSSMNATMPSSMDQGESSVNN